MKFFCAEGHLCGEENSQAFVNAGVFHVPCCEEESCMQDCTVPSQQSERRGEMEVEAVETHPGWRDSSVLDPCRASAPICKEIGCHGWYLGARRAERAATQVLRMQVGLHDLPCPLALCDPAEQDRD